MAHALVIGGTGMLGGTVIELMDSFGKVSVAARNKKGFDRLKKSAGKSSSKLSFIQIDYNDYGELTKSLLKAVQDHGEFTLAVLWIHSSAKLAPLITAKVINETSQYCKFVEILGSANSAPGNRAKERMSEFRDFSNIEYHSITLGFVIEKEGSRWLTDKEISGGITNALKNNYPEHVIGVTEPWEKHP